ncbi:hypothetical protein [Zobellia galactanivorans]|uniref:hypothetical protein n=1 Tax=Zobellia galactanivorans (strain DSM 12802 / CCUG 47099 / CIP 106680 / NCIMB 13871 / Dsij) TaxID=63186 RepID=UPI001C070C7E|nr:hypothetical protein [Zobellia galactanivorans]MBU3024720.1 hypothetical protein [Zobellia galactanivorans]
MSNSKSARGVFDDSKILQGAMLSKSLASQKKPEATLKRSQMPVQNVSGSRVQIYQVRFVSQG